MKYFLTALFIFSLFFSKAQTLSNFLKKNAVQVVDPAILSDSIYKLLSPYQIIMVGEMHGSNEPAQLVSGIANMFALYGDSVQVGLEIPSSQMAKFILSRTDSSIYLSDFFKKPVFESGRESFAWAKIISSLKNKANVQIFFFDTNEGEGKTYERDSFMYLNLKKQFLIHPSWKMVTISGNFHNMTSPQEKLGEKTMGSYLKNDAYLNLSSKICSINHIYHKGVCRANFGKGLELRQLESPLSEYDTTLSFDKYLILGTSKSKYPYKGIYYTRDISAANMVKGNTDFAVIRTQLEAIRDRDQKTRVKGDSTQFMAYIDSCNLAQVEVLITKYGWPGKSLLGAIANNTVFLVIQHADLVTQEKYLPLLKRSVDEGESRSSDLALLQDRVLMRQGKKQIYGSQLVFNKSTGAQEFYPIEDEKNVNLRRKSVGLISMEEYAKYFGIDYKLPID